MMRYGRVGVLGGTFDPIHVGHVAAAGAACDALVLDVVLLMPSRVPPHRPAQPLASPFHRFAMTALAAQARPAFAASDLELLAPGPTYTSATLGRLAEAGYDASQLFFITGSDAFAEIALWRDYPALLDRSHFVVVTRPGHTVHDLPALLPALAGRMTAARGPVPPHPAILLLDAPTPDVSATEIRRRVATGEPIDGLVPPLVHDHILRHRLYAGRSLA